MNTTNATNHYDVIVIGGGPGGSTLAAYLAQAGVRVLIIEKEAFPRYHIGESLTGMAAGILHEFGLGPTMDELHFPPKSGVKVIGQEAKSEFFVPVLQPTWQVRRDQFDDVLLKNALTMSAHYRRGTVKEILRDGDKVIGVCYLPADSPQAAMQELYAEYVVDASGRANVLARQGIAGEVVYDDQYSRQVAVFTQFKDALRDPGDMGNNTFLFYSELHHWAWFIPLSPDVTSVGVVMPAHRLKAAGSASAALAWGLENINPDLRRRVAGRERVEEIRTITNYSYKVDPFVGNGWLCIGDAHRFIDPIFSFGASLAMLEAKAASRAILTALATGDWTAPFAEYIALCNRGQSAAYDVIRYFWKYPVFFGYQSRGKQRKEFMRLLSSDVHDEQELPALQMMRRTLQKFDQQ
ncbi:MAG: NAD(P)/FAD-dependent oxidoreductase [Chloroflexi bacterium]|nr:NAD(P)/FAD-dependent oxidoreductase [Chloroflexota bacterium]MCI0645367.1 NAD(P)/FAD-dependent oxidoreductase [Chloroflexota bacterium]MCI0727202.1 NAD(P)/FAD-dependent oxidoreductase [Chloroflexota bacterium]